MGGGGASRPNTTNPNEAYSQSGGSSSSSSEASSFRDPASVWGGQSPYLQGLYGQGGQLAQNQAGMASGQGMYDKAMAGFDSLMNPGVNPQMQAYQGEVQRNLERNMLPAIQSQAGQFGQMGGARQGVAEGLAVSGANQQVTDMAANLYNADRNRQVQAMSQAPALGTFGQQVPWYAANQYAGILGDPTVLQGAAGSESSSSSSASNFGWSSDTGGGTDKQGWDVNAYYGVGG